MMEELQEQNTFSTLVSSRNRGGILTLEGVKPSRVTLAGSHLSPWLPLTTKGGIALLRLSWYTLRLFASPLRIRYQNRTQMSPDTLRAGVAILGKTNVTDTDRHSKLCHSSKSKVKE